MSDKKLSKEEAKDLLAMMETIEAQKVHCCGCSSNDKTLKDFNFMSGQLNRNVRKRTLIDGFVTSFEFDIEGSETMPLGPRIDKSIHNRNSARTFDYTLSSCLGQEKRIETSVHSKEEISEINEMIEMHKKQTSCPIHLMACQMFFYKLGIIFPICYLCYCIGDCLNRGISKEIKSKSDSNFNWTIIKAANNEYTSDGFVYIGQSYQRQYKSDILSAVSQT